jgi:hypothetical protein
MSNDAVKREIRRLRDRILERDFRSAAPPLDEDGLPNWSGGEPLTTEGYAKALGDSPDAALSDEELETRHRLAPFRGVFEQLDATSGGEDVT